MYVKLQIFGVEIEIFGAAQSLAWGKAVVHQERNSCCIGDVERTIPTNFLWLFLISISTKLSDLNGLIWMHTDDLYQMKEKSALTTL